MKKNNVISTLLYLLSILFFAYAAWWFVIIVKDLVATIGQGAKIPLKNIIDTFVNYCGDYLVYSVVIASLGYLIKNNNKTVVFENSSDNISLDESIDENISLDESIDENISLDEENDLKILDENEGYDEDVLDDENDNTIDS